MNRSLPALALAALIFPHPAPAHGPSRQGYCELVAIAASPAVVWALAGDFAHPERWLPAVENAAGQGGADKGAVRELRLRKGGTLREEIVTADPAAMKLKTKFPGPVDPVVLPVNSFSATLEVRPGPTGGSFAILKAGYYRWFTPNNPPPGQDEKAANAAVAEYFRGGFGRLKALAEGREAQAGEAPTTVVECKSLPGVDASGQAADAAPANGPAEPASPMPPPAEPAGTAEAAPAATSDEVRYPAAYFQPTVLVLNLPPEPEPPQSDARYPAAHFEARVTYRNPEYFGESQVR